MHGMFWPSIMSRKRLLETIFARKTRAYVAGLLTLGLLAAVAALVSPSASATEYSVGIQNVQFNPNTLTINVGDTVTWTNNETDGTVHSSTSDDGVWNSPDMPPGAQFSFTFTTAGTFAYHCRFHPSATGTITVNGGNPPPTTTPTPPPPTTTTTDTPPPTTTTTEVPPPTTTTTEVPPPTTTTTTTAPPPPTSPAPPPSCTVPLPTNIVLPTGIPGLPSTIPLPLPSCVVPLPACLPLTGLPLLNGLPLPACLPLPAVPQPIG